MGCRFWIMWLSASRFRFVRAEPPCMKGELQIYKLLIGWQA